MTFNLLRFLMSRLPPIFQLLTSLGLLGFGASVAVGQVVDTVSGPLRQHQYDLSTDGRAFLLKEAASASFFLLGELHGEKEIPALIRGIWPSLWQSGYRYIAAEVSPWAANQLEFRSQNVAEPIRGLWSPADASYVASFKKGRGSVLWGCDIEEIQPHLLIRHLASAIPKNPTLQSIAAMTRSGYRRSMAPELLRRLQEATEGRDISRGVVSLQSSILRTLEVEIDRLSDTTRLRASTRREALMKDLFYRQYQKNPKAKVLARFGRNHLHRGYDRRGVSTLGNFIAELAVGQGLQTFNLATFGAGGQIFWPDSLLEWDERKDDPAFEFLASMARYPATVFDLRPIRQALHRIPENQRSQVEASLVYWADSYDAILCYQEVTPLEH
jgi:hypothetical protein